MKSRTLALMRLRRVLCRSRLCAAVCALPDRMPSTNASPATAISVRHSTRIPRPKMKRSRSFAKRSRSLPICSRTLNFGLALLRAGKTAEGIAELVKRPEAGPSIPHTWFNLGIAYKKAGEEEKAIAAVRADGQAGAG